MENRIEKILVGCRNNERGSQKALYQLFYKAVSSICYRYGVRSEVVEKLATDSFVNIFSHIDGFQCSQSDDINTYRILKGWVSEMVVLTCIEHYRKEIAISDTHNLLAETTNMQIGPQYGNNTVSNKQIIEAIRRLPPAGRIIYNLFAIEGMSHEKIAALLNISISDSRSTLERTREKLKHSLYPDMLRDQNKVHGILRHM